MKREEITTRVGQESNLKRKPKEIKENKWNKYQGISEAPTANPYEELTNFFKKHPMH